jgi:hypothetical protein
MTVLDDLNAMSDAIGPAAVDRRGNRLDSTGFTGVKRERKPVLAYLVDGGEMRIRWESAFGTCQVEPDDSLIGEGDRRLGRSQLSVNSSGANRSSAWTAPAAARSSIASIATRSSASEVCMTPMV